MHLLLSIYSPYYPRVLTYMLQNVEYQVGPYLKWYRRTHDFSKVMYRRNLVKTRAAKLLLLVLSVGMMLQALLGMYLLIVGLTSSGLAFTVLGTLMVALYPVVWAYLITVPLLLGRWLIVEPRNRRSVKKSQAIFAKHPGVKLAIAGSYGKTSMKELLNTIFGEGKKVAATPANKNVSVSHAVFAQKLKGDEDILIIEYGEGAPGDVERFAKVTHPTAGIITGLAPAHLDHYPDLKTAGKDIFSLANYVGDKNTYVNKESVSAQDFIKPGYNTYDANGVMGWKISDIKVGFDGTKFTMTKGSKTIKLHSALLGKHQVGPLALGVALADHYGLDEKQIKAGVGKTQPFEHRMQPRALHGAWIIDDTYNGNIDGLKAGLQLLNTLPGKNKIYVTPGLVDQGVETQSVHEELGRAIAATPPDKVVLMKNSVTEYIKVGLDQGDYKGDLQIEEAPLEFYTNLEHMIASGDVVLMQNDWTDNYN